MVRISFENKEIFLGYYADLSEAIKIREEAEMKYYGQIFTNRIHL